MKKIKLSVFRKPGRIDIENFDEVNEYIKEATEPYINKDHGNNISRIHSDRRALLKLKDELEGAMKEPIRVYNEPLEKAKFNLLRLTSRIDAALSDLDEQVERHRKSERDAAIGAVKKHFLSCAAPLGGHAQSVFESPSFIEERWLGGTCLSIGTKAAIERKIEKAALDISTIETTCGTLTPVMLAKYFETLCIDDVTSFKEAVVKAANGHLPGVVRTLDDRNGRGRIELCCSEDAFLRTLDQLKLMDIDYSVISSTYPAALCELKEPSFDTFVALDIETTGSLGAACGDGPAEITEIGAVKVENGIVTERFSMLADPGRRITPHVARLTHITDEMVRGKPPVDEVIREFFKFAGDLTLVGHGIKGSDLPYICRAAERAGVSFNNAYFDTCEYASRLKEKYGWQRIRLEYLSELFGVKQKEAHRAWCDAEANVGVYFALKALK